MNFGGEKSRFALLFLSGLIFEEIVTKSAGIPL